MTIPLRQQIPASRASKPELDRQWKVEIRGVVWENGSLNLRDRVGCARDRDILRLFSECKAVLGIMMDH